MGKAHEKTFEIGPDYVEPGSEVEFLRGKEYLWPTPLRFLLTQIIECQVRGFIFSRLFQPALDQGSECFIAAEAGQAG